MAYKRALLKKMISRLQEPRRFIQVISGPRQVGKTTLAGQIENELTELTAYHTADDTTEYGSAWIDRIWEALRVRMRLERQQEAALFIDEIQKIKSWSETVKKNWDKDTRDKLGLKVVLLGSSRLLMQEGLSDSLAGRFEFNHCGYWNLAEMEEAFSFSAEQYQWFGGYPGAAGLIADELRFKEYIRSAIVEPTLMRDILMTTRIEKPALLRQLFEVGTAYSGQIVSYTKMLGQLQDAGNTTTLAKYLRLLEQSGLISGLNKYNSREIETKGTIPKFQTHNTALLSAIKTERFKEALVNTKSWGVVYENSVGAYLVDQVCEHPHTALYYWREDGKEIDFVVKYGKTIIGIEAKSGNAGIPGANADKFRSSFPKAKLILVGEAGIPYDVFMKTNLPDIAAAL